MKILKNVNLFGKITDIAIDNGKFAFIGKCEGEGIDLSGKKIYPGLIDIHSHGVAGKDSSVDELSCMADFMLANGTTTWYPTTMTVAWGDLVRVTNVNLELGHGANIPGFHLEGPFINKKHKGAQNEGFILTPTLDLLKECKNVKIITVAPEVEGAMEFIEKCGIVVAIGHTDCDYDTAKEAFRRGAKSLTHTFNVMNPIHHRAPGPIPAGADCGAYAQLISDGKHIHPSVCRLLYKLYGKEHVTLISDSMMPTGVGDGEYFVGGQKVIVKDGTARTEGGALAGSTTTLFECVKTAIGMGIPEYDAVYMASTTPATLMGLNKGKIEVGYDADFIVVDDDFNLCMSVARGEF